MLTLLIPVAVLAVIVIIAVIAFQRGREGFDLSGNTVLRAYLYLGSFAGVIVVAFGLSALLNAALASVVGNEFVRGGTFAVFGALFYGAHRAARGAMSPRGTTVADHGGLRRAYLLLGTVVFGLGAIALLPAGVYQLLANAILPSSTGLYRPGVADSLTSGVVSLVFWLIYLRAVLGDARGGGSPRFY